MATKLPATDIVIIGLGWTGSIIAESMTRAGYKVVAIERGPWRDTATDFPPNYAPDELRYAVRLDLFVRTAQTTLTFRNNPSQTALPVREWGAFLLPNGVGGAGLHWNAEIWRFLPTDFVLKTHLTQRYGAKFLPDDMTIQDWGVTYDELEPYYDAFEYLCGASGTAGNLRGQKQPFGNPFEGPRSRPYPTPAQKQPYGPVLWAEAAKAMGYSPFPQPSGNLSQAYTNPLGVTLGPCTFCGFCERFGCGNYSKASPQITILPVLMRRSNFEARTECEVTKINLDNTGKRATGVTYIDSDGREWEQPAEMVFLCAFQMFNVQLLLLSGIGQPYDVSTGQGVIGRNFSYQTTSVVQGFFDNKIFNTADVATGIGGWTDDEFVDAVQNGIGHGGIHLYPAMPYTYYTRITREDVIAIRAYLDTVEPVQNKVIANQLPFPFNQRETMIGWNELYFKPGKFKPDPSRSEEWNRGAYIVEGAEHCGLCHTPKNVMGGDENSQAMQGSVLQNWYAPNLTGNRQVGIGDWTIEDIALYLKTGRNRYDIASGPMADAVSHSTSHLTDADLRAIAVYLQDLPAGGGLPQPVSAQDPAMQRGQAIYNQQCAACHTVGGEGIVGLFPRLSGAPLVQQAQATSLIRVVLEGSRAVATDEAPTGPAMPSFAWKLSDADIADVITYIRNAWGNAAPTVSAGEVGNMRQALHREAQAP